MIAEKEWLKKYIGYDTNTTHPVTILHMYDMCNLQCSCCYVRQGCYMAIPSGTFLSDDALRNVVKESAERNQCIFTGIGEPFLFWDKYTKPKLLPLLKEYGAKCVISTNGLWGNNDDIIKDIISLEPECINFSIDYYHKVPIESLNHAIEILSSDSVKTRIFMSQITDSEHPIGHIKPINYDKLVKVEYPLNRNSNSNQGLSFHDADGHIIYTSTPTTKESSLNVFV